MSDDPRRTVAIPEDLHRDFKVEAARRDILLKDATADAITLWLNASKRVAQGRTADTTQHGCNQNTNTQKRNS